MPDLSLLEYNSHSLVKGRCPSSHLNKVKLGTILGNVQTAFVKGDLIQRALLLKRISKITRNFVGQLFPIFTRKSNPLMIPVYIVNSTTPSPTPGPTPSPAPSPAPTLTPPVGSWRSGYLAGEPVTGYFIQGFPPSAETMAYYGIDPNRVWYSEYQYSPFSLFPEWPSVRVWMDLWNFWWINGSYPDGTLWTSDQPDGIPIPQSDYPSE
ncbi:MAG: hypothetical protein ACRCT1_15470 [Microcoleaceae cyanobacterium]